MAKDGTITRAVIDPTALGIKPVTPEAAARWRQGRNAEVVREVLAGRGGGARDAVLLNAAAGIAAYDGLDGGGDTRSLDEALAERIAGRPPSRWTPALRQSC